MSGTRPTQDREMTETQKPPSKSKIFDFPCICQKKVVPLQSQFVCELYTTRDATLMKK